MGAAIWVGILQVQILNQNGTCDGNATVPGHWMPPPVDHLKLNCDAAVLQNGNQVGVGVVCRDYRGSLVGAMGEILLYRLQPRAAELMAILKGLEWCNGQGWRGLIIETDCLEAVQLVNGTDECLADEGLLVDRIRFLMGSMGIQGIHFVPRVVNGAAHVVAGFVARDNGDIVS
ncbi:uncharacterized protein LOC133716613 [Rosa rugosa]|uniref:uncharacterized protein LOC133716613 n=1 Tax=Rosa rugosa TaxID=74645 RepID=UPI002B402230|nr:uncharacterized protein LOC133716613 [Rosa rugosa]